MYEINSKKIFNLIGLPHEIVKYINEFDEITLKTLILIFSENRPLTELELSQKLKIENFKIKIALKNLEQKKIISFVDTIFPNAFQITSDELKYAKNNNIEMKVLFEKAEQLYARPLKPIERRTFLYIADFFNLEVDAILMAIDFGIRQKKTLNQIYKICEIWSNDGVFTHEQAEKQIKILTEKISIENKIKRCFGIYGRMLSVNEKKFIENWTSNYKFNIAMIKLAFEKCVDAIGKLSFQYIEKILLNWKNNNIKMPQDLNENEKIKKNDIYTAKNKKNIEPSYNLEEMVKNSKLIIQKELKHMEKF